MDPAKRESFEEEPINSRFKSEAFVNPSAEENVLKNNVDVHILTNPLKSTKNILVIIVIFHLTLACVILSVNLFQMANQIHNLENAYSLLRAQTIKMEINLLNDIRSLKKTCKERAELNCLQQMDLSEEDEEAMEEELLRDKRDVGQVEAKQGGSIRRNKVALERWRKKLRMYCLKQSQKFMEKINKQNKTKEVSAIQLRGGLPEIIVKDKVITGMIGPWYYQKEDSTNQIPSFKLEDSSVIIIEDGVYLLYAQVYYLSTSGSNSYSLVKIKQDKSGEETLATCSEGTGAKGELSCFTATVRALSAGDRLYLKERERERRVLFRDGQTYFGLVLLSS